uniref:Uncharacterized protein n=1 Tax=Oryzias latipes TaxID=8090 RepID=A0A3B3HWL5_ORYLA
MLQTNIEFALNNVLDQQLLLYAKEGNSSLIKKLLQARMSQSSSLNINCRSQSQSTPGWTALHLASSFGYREVVEELLKAGVDVNLQECLGDTPLHKAAQSGRKEIVLLLLRYDAHANIINGTGRIPKDVTDDDEIHTMLEAAERREIKQREQKLLEAAREGNLHTLLSDKGPPDIHCRDSVGNTPLHCAAYRGQKQCILKLLKCGASPNVKNSYGISVYCSHHAVALYSYFLGWRSYWVVIENGTISWYKKRWEFFFLLPSMLPVKLWDHCFFMLRCFDDTVHHFRVPSKINSVCHHSIYCRHLAIGSCFPRCVSLMVTDVFVFAALAAPLLLKAKETCDLTSQTCAALHLCLELLSKQEEVREMHVLFTNDSITWRL